jgi:hypothetical protein
MLTAERRHSILPDPASGRTSMVGEGIAPSAANPEPCVIVSDHTAPQCMVTCD